MSRPKRRRSGPTRKRTILSDRIAPAYQETVGTQPQYGPTLPYAYESEKLRATKPSAPSSGASAVDTSDMHADTVLNLHQFVESNNPHSRNGSIVEFGTRLAAGESPRSALKSHAALMNNIRQQALLKHRYGFDGDDL